ncbi:MAG: flagellin [Oscillospiraceae bacterium]
MRITQNFTNRSYLRNNNKVLTSYNKSMEKIWSQKDYFRASDDSINSSKAMTVRKNLRDLEMYDDNLKTADGVFKAAEDNLYSIANNIYLNIQTKLETACNGTYNREELSIIAEELEQYAGITIETLNSDYAERRLFGGTNNSSPAFATEVENGRTYVTYNGIRVDDMVRNEDGELCYYTRIDKAEYDAAADPTTVLRRGIPDGEIKLEDIEGGKTAEEQYNELAAADPDSVYSETDSEGNVTYYQKQYNYYRNEMPAVPASKPIYVDIGIGIKYDNDGNIDPQTALDVGLNGAEITGFGTDEDTKNNEFYSNNFVQLIFDAAAALKEGDMERANATLDRLNTANTGILTEITTLGAKQNSIEFYLSKNEEYKTSLQSRQNDVEGCDMNEEIINMDSTEAAYNAALQLSSRVLPRSIFDFI